MIDSKLYKALNGKCVSLCEYLMSDLDFKTKSANSYNNHFEIDVKTTDNTNTNKHYTFALNEMEVSYSRDSSSIFSIVLRDTSVNKKIELSNSEGLLIYAKGQDTVGLNSEVNGVTSIEEISELSINDDSFIAPFNLTSLYKSLTGIDLEIRELSSGTKWWDAL